MESYNNFIGIDIGKFTFVIARHGHKDTQEYENNSAGIGQFFQDNKKYLAKSLCVIEPTGGHELALILKLASLGYAVHRANTVQVKNFIRSFKNAVKTDKLDAKALAFYGFERHRQLELFAAPSAKALELFELVQRRHDLKQMLVAEKNRRQSPGLSRIKDSCNAMIKAIEDQMNEVVREITRMIEEDENLKEKKKILKSIPGIGDTIAHDLLVLLPELGLLNRRQIASLAGVSPKANESGRFRGYRKTGYGRCFVKPIIFMAAMAARNSKQSELRFFYERLIANGKKKMVALVAVMRKIIIIANARIKEFNQKNTTSISALSA